MWMDQMQLSRPFQIPILLIGCLCIFTNALGQKEITAQELKIKIDKIVSALEKMDSCYNCQVIVRDCVTCIEDQKECYECPNCPKSDLKIWRSAKSVLVKYKKNYSLLAQILNPPKKYKQKRRALDCYLVLLKFRDHEGDWRRIPYWIKYV